MLFKKEKKAGIEKAEPIPMPDGLWLKCDGCGEILYRRQLDQNFWICPKCSFHFRISCHQYIALLLDDGAIETADDNLAPTNPLNFPKYKEKMKESQTKTGLKDGIISGRAKIGGVPVAFAITEFDFVGGSMGSVVGERVARTIRRARTERIPFVMLTASGGGARMQEGILSLMQMAKTSAELALLARAGIPYITILTHPTMAGVMASFASLGDVIIAEPGALLGFTGPRVIEQTIGEKLPDGFQRSEFLLKHGMVDIVVSRKELRATVIQLLDLLHNKNRKTVEATGEAQYQ